MKVKGTLEGVDGNAFVLMAHFRVLAKKQNLPQQWVSDVLNEAKQGDYDHLVTTLMANMEDEHVPCD